MSTVILQKLFLSPLLHDDRRRWRGAVHDSYAVLDLPLPQDFLRVLELPSSGLCGRKACEANSNRFLVLQLRDGGFAFRAFVAEHLRTVAAVVSSSEEREVRVTSSARGSSGVVLPGRADLDRRWQGNHSRLRWRSAPQKLRSQNSNREFHTQIDRAGNVALDLEHVRGVHVMAEERGGTDEANWDVERHPLDTIVARLETGEIL